jgi:hypothetical protein
MQGAHYLIVKQTSADLHNNVDGRDKPGHDGQWPAQTPHAVFASLSCNSCFI